MKQTPAIAHASIAASMINEFLFVHKKINQVIILIFYKK